MRVVGTPATHSQDVCVGYTVRAVFEAPPACEIDVELIFASAPEPGRMRWIREASDGSPATPDVKGEWYLYLWGPWAMLNRGRGDNDAN